MSNEGHTIEFPMISSKLFACIKFRKIICCLQNPGIYGSCCFQWISPQPEKIQQAGKLHLSAMWAINGLHLWDPTSKGKLKIQPSWISSWWLNQPIWKICSSNWIISPGRGETKKCLKPPSRFALTNTEEPVVFTNNIAKINTTCAYNCTFFFRGYPDSDHHDHVDDYWMIATLIKISTGRHFVPGRLQNFRGTLPQKRTLPDVFCGNFNSRN